MTIDVQITVILHGSNYYDWIFTKKNNDGTRHVCGQIHNVI